MKLFRTIILLILVVGLLALTFTDWSIDTPAKKVATKPTTDADYFFEGVLIKSFDSDGRKINQVKANKIEHYLQTQVSQIDTPSLSLLSQSGSEWIINAASGEMNLNIETVSLVGNVLVSQNPNSSLNSRALTQTEIKTTDLQVDLAANKITTSNPVVISSSGMQTVAEGMIATIDNEELELLGKVRTRGATAKSTGTEHE